jgi:uncharacterized protein YjbJ (UPF0337 family)
MPSLDRRLTCLSAYAREDKSRQEGTTYENSIKDQVEGKLHETKGKIKEQAGKLTNSPDFEAEGLDEKLGGKIQKKVGQIEKVLEK